MLKVRFRFATQRNCLMLFSTDTEALEFHFSDCAGDPLSPLIETLISLHNLVKTKRRVSFCQEPGFVFLELNKVSEEEVVLTVNEENEPPKLTYVSDWRSLAFSFWRGLRLFQENFPQEQGVWAHPNPFGDLEKLEALLKNPYSAKPPRPAPCSKGRSGSN